MAKLSYARVINVNWLEQVHGGFDAHSKRPCAAIIDVLFVINI